jgi:hypothetical protein
MLLLKLLTLAVKLRTCIKIQTSKSFDVDIFWDIVQCSPYVNRRFGETYHLHLQGLLPASSIHLFSQTGPCRVRVTLRLTVCQSVRLGVEPTLGLTTRCCFPLEGWCLKFSVLSLFGHPLWREVGSVICQSKSVVFCQGKIHLYIFCVIHISYRTCTYNIYKASFSPCPVQQIMPYYLQVAHATTAVQTLERSYTRPPPSLGLLYFLCRASPCLM